MVAGAQALTPREAAEARFPGICAHFHPRDLLTSPQPNAACTHPRFVFRQAQARFGESRAERARAVAEERAEQAARQAAAELQAARQAAAAAAEARAHAAERAADALSGRLYTYPLPRPDPDGGASDVQ